MGFSGGNGRSRAKGNALNEQKLTSDIYRAQRAKALLDDELLNEAFKSVRDDLMTTWATCELPEQRERIWVSVNVLDQIKAALITAVANGRVAQHEIDAIAAREGKAA